MSEQTAGHLRMSPAERPLPQPAARTDEELLTRLSMNQMTTCRWTFLEDVTACSEAGFSRIGLWRPKLVEFGEERGIELIRDAGLGVSSLSFAGGFTGGGGESFQDSVEEGLWAVQLAGELGADCLVIVSGGRCGHTTKHARRLLVDALTILGEEALQWGVRLALQPMQRRYARGCSFLNTLDDALEVIRGCGHPQVGLAFDVGGLWGEPRLLERIGEIAPLVSTVQLNDAPLQQAGEYDQRIPGAGVIPLGGVIEAFLAAGYGGAFELKIWSEELWRANYHELLGLCRGWFEQSICGLRRRSDRGVLR